MNISGNNDVATMFAVLVGLLLVGFAVWIMNTFDVNFAVASTTVLRLIAWGVAVAVLIFWGYSSGLNIIKNTAPLTVSFFWYALFPILDYNAGVREDFPFQVDIDWYGTTFWQFIIFLGINVIGYGIIYYLHRRNSYYY